MIKSYGLALAGLLTVASAAMAAPEPISFRCNLAPAPGFVDHGGKSTPVACPGKVFYQKVQTSLPFTVPAGKRLCLSTMYLMTKYAHDPAIYNGGHEHAMYLEIPGMTVASHHPEVHFTPSLVWNTSEPFTIKISNGMTEAINVHGVVTGWVVRSDEDCP